VSAADEQLAEEALAGSQRAYRELVRRFERPVFNLVARMVHDRTLAEDLTQDAFVKAFSRLDTYQSGQGKFSNWLFKIAHNTAIDHLRRARVDTVPLDANESDAADFHAILSDPDDPTPLDRAVTTDLAGALSAAVDRLRPEYREVIVLRHQEGMAYEEIAEIAGLPLGTVKTYIHRARKELAELLTEAGWGPAGAAAPETRARPFS
jgi:RNA polymerase sigma-70 factor (ECF subfamily)